MSVNQTQRVEGVVKGALKEVALNEPFGFAVSGPSHWPFINEEGQIVGMGPGWCVLVTIRAANPGEEDFGRCRPLPGVLPTDEEFRTAAVGLLESCREERAQQRDDDLAKARAAFRLSMERRG